MAKRIPVYLVLLKNLNLERVIIHMKIPHQLFTLFFLILLSLGPALVSQTAAAGESPKELVIASEYAGTNGTGGNFGKLAKGFTEATGIKVRFIGQGKANLADFIPIAEADLVITSVGDELEAAKRAGHLRQDVSENRYIRHSGTFPRPRWLLDWLFVSCSQHFL